MFTGIEHKLTEIHRVKYLMLSLIIQLLRKHKLRLILMHYDDGDKFLGLPIPKLMKGIIVSKATNGITPTTKMNVLVPFACRVATQGEQLRCRENR